MATPALFALESNMPAQLLHNLLRDTETDSGAVDLPELMAQAFEWLE